MRRRYRSYTRTNDRYDDVSLTEFKFYNKRKDFIKKELLNSLVEKAITTQKPIYWTNDYFAKNKLGFMIYQKNNQTMIGLIKTKGSFIEEDFNNSQIIFGKQIFLQFDIDEKQHDILDKYYIPEDGKNNNKIFICKDWRNVINALIVTRAIQNGHDTSYRETCKTETSIIFPNNDINFVEYKVTFEGYRGPGLFHILEVVERRIEDKNYRVALCAVFERSHSEDYKYMIFDEDDVDYNYIDKDRIFIKADDIETYYFADISINNYETRDKKTILTLNLDAFKYIARDARQILGKQKIITPAIYRFYNDRVVAFEDYRHRRELNEEENLLLGRYKEILMAKRTLKIDKLLVTNNSLTLNNGNFSMTFSNSFLNVMDYIWEIRELVKKDDIAYNINQFYEAILKLSSLKVINKRYVKDDKYKNFVSAKFKLNDTTIKVQKRGNRIYINENFCRIDDIFHILSKAICYRTSEEFNEYIHEVSFIGVKWKVMISNGISIEVNNPFFNTFKKIGMEEVERLYLRFSLLWDMTNRRKIYLMLNNKQYLIKQKQKFIRHFGLPKQELSMGDLRTYLMDCLENLNDDSIIEIVENAIEEAKIIKERGEELVKVTIKEINAESTKIEIGGKEIAGYALTGLHTKSKYFINGNSLDVYKYQDGKWNRRCVVDDHRKQRIFEDRLANRLMNIRNEPKKIYTLFNT